MTGVPTPYAPPNYAFHRAPIAQPVTRAVTDAEVEASLAASVPRWAEMAKLAPGMAIRWRTNMRAALEAFVASRGDRT